MRNSKCKIVTLMAGIIGLAALPASGNTNVLLDNFNDGNFAGWTVDSGTWTVNNGTLVGHRALGSGLDAYIYAGDTNWSDFVFEADAIFQDGNANLLFRSTVQWTNEYRFGVFSQNAGAYANRFYLIEYHDGVVSNIVSVASPASLSPVVIGDTAHLRADAVGSLLSFYIDNQLIYQYDDPTPLENGQVGLGVIWNWTDAFDNVSVTLIPEANSFWALVPAGILILVARRTRSRRGRPNQSTII